MVSALLEWKPDRSSGSLEMCGPRLIPILLVIAVFPLGSGASEFPIPRIPWNPESYICYRTGGDMIMDGRMDESSWHAAPWTDDFVDIEGDLRPEPRFQTRAKMLWDDTYFYIGAYLEEPDIWATLTERDAVIFRDNDFEVFIDPDGDTHKYYELEINALGTEWDLFLPRPYRDGGPAVTGWDIKGLKTGVHLDGSLNEPSDTDRGWNVEIAFPWAILGVHADTRTPPHAGDQWRVNFSRVQWKTKVVEGSYAKETNPEGDKPLPEDNWVWSPQGLIAMHYPEMWGFVQFSEIEAGLGSEDFVPRGEERIRWALREIYYIERIHFAAEGRYTADPGKLALADPEPVTLDGRPILPPEIRVTPSQFEIVYRLQDVNKSFHITQDGRVWSQSFR
jgi:hypothetical protein